MSTFEESRSILNQTHFETLEFDLPVINGTCTIGSSDGFGTPLTCDQPWVNEYKTYKFTNADAPLLPASNIYRCVNSINENTTQIKPGNGLSARGSLSITFTDFIADPNDGAQGVTEQVKKQGTFFGKMNARQIMTNKNVRLKLYRLEADGSIDLVNGAETHYYIIESFKSNDNGTWSLQCKDVLSLANLDEKTWPPTSEGFLRQDIDDSVTAIPVDSQTDYSTAFAVRIGDEFMRIITVDNNLGSNTVLNVAARGSSITAPVSGVRLTTTEVSSHSGGDEVFICDLSDNETIDSLLTRILVASDFDPLLIPSVAWAAEVLEWHALDKINTLHSESKSVNEKLGSILTGFLMDMWFDQIDNKAKLSAISVWKESTAALIEGKEIDAYTLKDQAVDSLRASRALVVYDKSNLSDNDDVSSFAKASQNTNNEVISEALYKEHKDKLFDNNVLIGSNAANLLTQRYVARFKFTPFNYKWTTQERFLTFKTGDVIDINADSIQSASGLPSTQLRAQITKIMPKYTKFGRVYDCTAMSYEAAFSNNSESVIDNPIGNGYSLYGSIGAPSTPFTHTFIIKGSYSYGDVAFRAGDVPPAIIAGSKIIIILVDGFDGQASGGTGGNNERNGKGGGIVYDAQGVDTDIYFSGDTSAISAAYPLADGYIRAPGGGGGGGSDYEVLDQHFNGGGGGGGAGRLSGVGGESTSNLPLDIDSQNGFNGDIAGSGGAGGVGFSGATDGGTGGNWGQAGTAASGGAAGLAGSGILDNGATVTLYGATAARYINGNGSHP